MNGILNSFNAVAGAYKSMWSKSRVLTGGLTALAALPLGLAIGNFEAAGSSMAAAGPLAGILMMETLDNMNNEVG